MGYVGIATYVPHYEQEGLVGEEKKERNNSQRVSKGRGIAKVASVYNLHRNAVPVYHRWRRGWPWDSGNDGARQWRRCSAQP